MLNVRTPCATATVALLPREFLGRGRINIGRGYRIAFFILLSFDRRGTAHALGRDWQE